MPSLDCPYRLPMHSLGSPWALPGLSLGSPWALPDESSLALPRRSHNLTLSVQPFVEEWQVVHTEESPELLLGPVMELFNTLIPIKVWWAARVVLRELRKLHVGVTH